MQNVNLTPYAFARARFSHACSELTKASRTPKERLLNAVIALTPLRPEDIPRSCQLLYEEMQQLIGADLWTDNITVGALPAAIRTLPLQHVECAVRFIVMAGETLDKHCGVQAFTRRVVGDHTTQE